MRVFLCALLLFAAAITELKSAPNYLKDLEEQGYCVIPQLFSDAETRVLYERVWHEFIGISMQVKIGPAQRLQK